MTALYWNDGQMRDEVYNWGSFVQSEMYAKGVTCSDCHEPHSLKLRKPGNLVCSQCHQPAKYDTPTHTHHAQGTAGAACVSCHMPTTTYMVVDPAARPFAAHSAAGCVGQARHAERVQQLPRQEDGAVGGRRDTDVDRQAAGELPAFRAKRLHAGSAGRSWRARRAADDHRRQGAAGHRPRKRHRTPGPSAHAGDHRRGVARIERQRRRRAPRGGRGAGRHRTGDAATVSGAHARRSGPRGAGSKPRARLAGAPEQGLAARRASGIRQGARRIHRGPDLQRGPSRRQDEPGQHLRAAARRRRRQLPNTGRPSRSIRRSSPRTSTSRTSIAPAAWTARRKRLLREGIARDAARTRRSTTRWDSC